MPDALLVALQANSLLLMSLTLLTKGSKPWRWRESQFGQCLGNFFHGLLDYHVHDRDLHRARSAWLLRQLGPRKSAYKRVQRLHGCAMELVRFKYDPSEES
jgi:hypothetical protein